MQNSSIITKAVLDFEHFANTSNVVDASASAMMKRQARTSTVKVAFLSDWFHIWLLSHEATRHTLGSFPRYLPVTNLLLGRADEVCSRLNLQGPMPRQISSFDGNFMLPACLTEDMYDWCRQDLGSVERAELVTAFVTDPASLRISWLG